MLENEESGGREEEKGKKIYERQEPMKMWSARCTAK
jgi:hypothetical protein